MSNSTPNQPNQPNQPNPQPQGNLWIKISAFTISGAVVLSAIIAFFANLSQIGGFALDLCEKYDITEMRDMCQQVKLSQKNNTDLPNVVEPINKPSPVNSSEKENSPIRLIRSTPNPSLNASPIEFRRSQ